MEGVVGEIQVHLRTFHTFESTTRTKNVGIEISRPSSERIQISPAIANELYFESGRGLRWPLLVGIQLRIIDYYHHDLHLNQRIFPYFARQSRL